MRARVCTVGARTDFGDMRVELHRSVNGFYCVHLRRAQPPSGRRLWRESERKKQTNKKINELKKQNMQIRQTIHRTTGLRLNRISTQPVEFRLIGEQCEPLTGPIVL